jgi:hypothetical protein
MSCISFNTGLCWLGKNVNTIKKNTATLSDTSNEVDLAVNVEKTIMQDKIIT